MKQFDFENLKEEVLSLLEKYELRPKVLSLSFVLPADQFDTIASDDLEQEHSGILQMGHTGPPLQWGIMIRREKKLEDFPPDAILSPSE